MAAKKSSKKGVAKVCRECHRVVEGESCSMCGLSNLTADWAGYLIVIDPAQSDVAKRMNITVPGRYALKVR